MKSQRHNAIRELLIKTTVSNNGAIGSQDALRRKLASRGFHVTQATLSRDIRELKLLKGPSGYALPNNIVEDSDDDPPLLVETLASFGLEVRQAQNLVVVITTMGGAQPVAASLDQEEWEEIVGTIAGDNTVLIISPDNRSAATLKARIEAHLA